MTNKKDTDKKATSKVGKVSKKLKVFKSPSAFSVLFVIIALMAGLTWVIPSGQYERKGGEIVPGSYQEIKDKEKDIPQLQKIKGMEIQTDKDGKEVKGDGRQGFWDIFVSPIYGMVQKLDVIVFILILGGFAW